MSTVREILDGETAPLASIEEATKTIHGNARAIADARRMHQPVIDSLEFEKLRVNELLLEAKLRLAKELEWPESRIAAAHRFLVEQGAAPKTFPTAFGVAKYSKSTKDYLPEIEDQDVFLAWLQPQEALAELWTQPEAPAPRPVAVKVRQTLGEWEVVGDRYITSDGEVVPGVVAVPTEPDQKFIPTERPE